MKITITLSKKSVDFFKSEAAKADTQYQRMIRRLLDAYVVPTRANPRLAVLEIAPRPHGRFERRQLP